MITFPGVDYSSECSSRSHCPMDQLWC